MEHLRPTAFENRTPLDFESAMLAEGVEIRRSLDSDDLSGTVDLSDFYGLSPSGMQAYVRAVACAINYVKGVLVLDSFQNHKERRDWRARMIEKYGSDQMAELRSKDKLRRNIIMSVLASLERLKLKLDESDIHTRKAEDIREMVRNIPGFSLDGYDTMSREDKIAVVNRVDTLARKFLRLSLRSESASVEAEAA